MNRKLLVLLIEGLLCAMPAAWAEEQAVVHTGMGCDSSDEAKWKECLDRIGKRIDDGDSLGARATTVMNAERELGTETFILGDIPPPVVAPPAEVSAPPVVAEPPAPPALVQTVEVSAPPPAVAAVAQEVVEVKKEVRETVGDQMAEPLFVSGYSDLTPRMISRLDELAEKLRGKDNLGLAIVGHTDPQRLSPRCAARYKDNYGLGLARANAAADYLSAALKLPTGRIKTESRGPDMPVAGNDSLEGMAQNRRIEIVASYDVIKVVAEKAPPPPAPVVPPPPPPPPPVIVKAPEPKPMAPPPPPPPAKVGSCEEVTASRLRAAPKPFRISIDGVPQDDVGVIDPDVQRCTDVALAKADLEIRYDPLDQTPVLNAHAWPNAIAKNEAVEITGWSNYAAFITKAELRLFGPEGTIQGEPLTVLPVQLGEPVKWTPAKDIKYTQIRYVLRVYGKDGQFDETRPKSLDIVDQQRPTEDKDKREREILGGYGENSLSIHNIQVSGGAVTASGNGVAVGDTVLFLGRPVPVDKKGSFAARQILPGGNHVVEVSVQNAQGVKSSYNRNLSIAQDDWFYLALADLTVGRNHTTGPAKILRADTTDHFDNKVYMDGRTAFYLKGKVKGEWLLTASADTREQPLKDMFRDISAKDPRYLLRRLDPNLYYPVYGDDSTTVDDAPTQGKFFVRVEKGDSQAMWGVFQTSITGTDLANYSRTLYGARAKYVSEGSTQYGERKVNVEAFGADPGTLQSRDEFRGTGGSMYYLRNLDVSAGSERVWIEVRDKDSDIVLETRHLTPAQDYEINALQGRVMLREALPSVVDDKFLVSNASLSGNPVHLVVTYEYSNETINLSRNMVTGGRASAWLNDHVQIGGTGLAQSNLGQAQRLRGLDATLRYKPGTYLKLEGARTNGAGNSSLVSSDGGFTFSTKRSTGGNADANRIEAAVSFNEVGLERDGKVTAYRVERDPGFSAPGQLTQENITQTGMAFNTALTTDTELRGKYDKKSAETQDTTATEVDLQHKINSNWKAGVGVRQEQRVTATASSSATLSTTGERDDLVGRLEYIPDAAEGADKADWSAYASVQGTLHQTGNLADNDRVALGGEKRINDRFKLGGEASNGDGGVGLKVSGDWKVDDRTSYYTSYTLTPDRTDEGSGGRNGLMTVGGRRRFSDAVSVYSEERLQHGSGPSGLIHAYGLDLTPNDRWTVGGKLETGKIADPNTGDLRRQAAGLNVGYGFEKTKYAGALEYRHEEGNTLRTTWLVKNNLGYQINPDWRFLGRVNFSVSRSSQGEAFDGNYRELVAGYAWRPVKHDRWNGLFRYTYLYNLPSPGQLSNGASTEYMQKSHVWSADVVHDVRPWVSLGGKIGVRRGSLKMSRTDADGDWLSSNTWLGVVRADWHWVHEWDVLTELRHLGASAASDEQQGALLAVYKHVGRNFKVGVGYNFTDFSDDLTDMSFRSHGWFLNLIGKM